jgi:hypothetical protein
MSKMPCKSILAVVKKKLKQVRGTCQKLAPQIKNIYVGGTSYKFCHGPIVPSYATHLMKAEPVSEKLDLT